MYLTEELFETADADHPHHSPSKQAMDHHNPQQHSPDHLGKRKRGAAADDYTPNTVPIKNIKISPSTHPHPADHAAPPTHILHAAAPDPTTLYPSPPRRKAARILAHPRRARPAPPQPSPKPRDADLTPCHHCGRRPRQKKELESYLSCADCGARTCFVCARVCERWAGCAGGAAARRICCECCVERGVEGETWCLRCVEEGGDDDDDDDDGGVDEDMVMG
ncbi:uncharacterized protein LTHEOB_11656 [Neofusicoccum parvum]|nr:uncharacterized protein LTHEOB_11656 [Neofusicoccum parvum]